MFVTGKGGVGKTTVAAALGCALSARGRTVALIEIGRDDISDRFELSPAGYGGATIAPRCTAFNITPRPAFEEYASRELRSHRLYSLVLDNRFVHYFLDATPGVNALLCLGKIWSMVQDGAWDHCIVDLPATGHGIGFLEVPRVVTAAVHLGPLRQIGTRLCETLEDPEQTGVCLVALCEELPVNETIEMADRLSSLHIDRGMVVANMVAPRPIAAADEVEYRERLVHWRDDQFMGPLIAATAFCRERWMAQERERERLVATFGKEMGAISRYDGLTERMLIQTVAESITNGNQ